MPLRPIKFFIVHNYVKRRKKGKDGKKLRHQLEEDSEDKENGICRGSCRGYHHHRPQVERKIKKLRRLTDGKEESNQ